MRPANTSGTSLVTPLSRDLNGLARDATDLFTFGRSCHGLRLRARFVAARVGTSATTNGCRAAREAKVLDHLGLADAVHFSGCRGLHSSISNALKFRRRSAHFGAMVVAADAVTGTEAAAGAAVVVATIMFTFSRISSSTKAVFFSGRPSSHRDSVTIVRPSTEPGFR